MDTKTLTASVKAEVLPPVSVSGGDLVAPKNKYGLRPGPGRPKGSKNKIGTVLRQAMQESLLQLGGVDYLVQLGQKEPKAYATLLAKCIPAEVTGRDGKDLIPSEIKKAVLVVPATLDSVKWNQQIARVNGGGKKE